MPTMWMSVTCEDGPIMNTYTSSARDTTLHCGRRCLRKKMPKISLEREICASSQPYREGLAFHMGLLLLPQTFDEHFLFLPIGDLRHVLDLPGN